MIDENFGVLYKSAHGKRQDSRNCKKNCKKSAESMHLSFGSSDNFNMQGVSTSLLKSGYLKSEE